MTDSSERSDAGQDRTEDETESTHVLILSRSLEKISVEVRWLAENGGVTAVSEIDEVTSRLPKISSAGHVIIIDVDSLGSLIDLFDDLLHLRDSCGCPIILVSSRLSEEFTLERLPLCDVCLGLPFSLTALNAAIGKAKENFRVWEGRRYQLTA